MGELLAELRAAAPRSTTCSVCTWLASRSEAERLEWAEALTDKDISSKALWRAAKARGYALSDNPWRDHRAAHVAA